MLSLPARPTPVCWQPDPLPVEERKGPAGNIGAVLNGVESSCLVIIRIIVSGRPREADARTQPVAVEGEFNRGELRVDVGRLAGDAVELVLTERLVELVGEIEPAPVPITGDPGIVGVHLVGNDQADWRRTHEESVRVEEELLAMIQIGMGADRKRVTRSEEVLSVVVGDGNALLPPLEQVQLAVRFLFELVEEGQVPLIPIPPPGSEKTNAEVVVAEQKAAEVAVESLNAGAHRDEIEIVAHVEQL